MTVSNVLGFYYGALADPIEMQANAQGYTLGEHVSKLEKLREAVVRLQVGGLLTETDAKRIKQKLHKRVMKNLRRATE